MLPRPRVVAPSLLNVLALAALVALSSLGWGQALSEYKAFNYVRNPETGTISRVEVTSAEHEERQKAMQTALKAVISQVLLGTFAPTPETFEVSDDNPLSPLIAHPNFLLLPNELSSEQRQRLQQAQQQGARIEIPQPLTDEERMQHIQTRLQRLFAVPDEIKSRLSDNPEYLDEVAESMASWTIYYFNLANWHAYVAQNVIRDELEEDETPQYDPAIAGEDRDATYTALQTKAQEKTQELENTYTLMVANIEKDRAAQNNYEDWLRNRENEMIAFAQKWMRRYDGTEIEMDNTVYLVRSYAERPKSGEEDRARDYLPANGVLVEVPRKKLVTPFDLIEDNGSLRKPN